MFTIITRFPVREHVSVAKKNDKFEDFCSFIREYDPDFVFLPAYLAAQKIKKMVSKGRSWREARAQVYEELGLKRTKRGRRILKVTEKILNSDNH